MRLTVERLRVPRGGRGGLRASPPSAREAAPLQKANAPPPRIPVAERLRVPRGRPWRPGRAAGLAPAGAGSRAATKRRMRGRHVFCSGTPPRSDRGCGGLRAPPPSAREAAPLQKANAWPPRIPVAERLRVPRGPGRAAGPTPVGAGSRAATKGECVAATYSCSGTPPRSEGGPGRAAGRTPVGAGSRAATKGECAAATYSCSGTPPRSDRGPGEAGQGGGPHPRRRGKPRRYKKANAAPLQKAIASPMGGAGRCVGPTQQKKRPPAREGAGGRASFTGPEGYWGVTARRRKSLTSPVGRVYSTDVPLSTTPSVAAVQTARSGEVSTA